MDTMLSKALREFMTGPLKQLVVNLGGEDADLWEAELNKFNRKEPCWLSPVTNAMSAANPAILRCISTGKSIVIGATTGTKTITSATDVFTWGIDSDFKNWNLDVPGEAKPETPAQVYEMVQDGNYATIFGSVGRDLDALCFTQEQIIAFVRDHKKWLRTGGYATFFLFRVGNEFFVASVFLSDGGRPLAGVGRFSLDRVWRADYRRRVVLPQTLES